MEPSRAIEIAGILLLVILAITFVKARRYEHSRRELEKQ